MFHASSVPSRTAFLRRLPAINPHPEPIPDPVPELVLGPKLILDPIDKDKFGSASPSSSASPFVYF
eukprot:6173869-Pleurochrysis_carterae.AAC.5